MEFASDWFRSYRLDLILGAIVVISPFFIFIHLFFNDSINIFSFYGIELTHYLGNNQNFVWQILSSIIPIGLLSILFYTTQSRWRYCLIILILLYFNRILFQLQIVDNQLDGFTTPLGFLLTKNLLNILIITDIFVFANYRKKAIILSFNNFFRSLYRTRYSKIKRQQIISIIKPNREASGFKYLSKIYHIQALLSNRLKIYDKNLSKRHFTHSFRLNLVIGIILGINILLFFIPYLVPENLTEIKIYGTVTIESNGFADVHTFIWYTLNKFIIVVPLVIWFLSTNYWWKYSILVPVILYAYQFCEAFQNIDDLDAAGNINTFPFLLLFILLVVAVSRFIRARYWMLDCYDYLSLEIEKLLNELAWKDNYKSISNKIDNNLFFGQNEETVTRFILEKLKQKLIDQLEVEL